jgi:hypothetical protein
MRKENGPAIADPVVKMDFVSLAVAVVISISFAIIEYLVVLEVGLPWPGIENASKQNPPACNGWVGRCLLSPYPHASV